MRVSESEHKLIVNERNRFRDENARLIDIICHHSMCSNCVNENMGRICAQQPCPFKLKPISKKKTPWPKCEGCGEPIHPQYPCEEAKLLRSE